MKIHWDMYRLNHYTVRNRWMVDTAKIAIFIWDGESPGIKAGYNYDSLRDKEAYLIIF